MQAHKALLGVLLGTTSLWGTVVFEASAQSTQTPEANTAKTATTQTTKPSEPLTAQSQTTEVTVTGKKAEVTDRIDRRVYDVKNDPNAQSGVVSDVLEKLPSVTVTPGGKIALRGDTNVTVLVDGKYPLNGNNVIQTISGADVDRIEVITNPSAQYAPDGTSGIINIITKKRHPFGISGNANLRLNTLGQYGGDTTATLNTGPWSITGQLHANKADTDFELRSRRTYPNTVDSQTRGTFNNANFGAETDVAYKISDTQTLSFDGQSFRYWGGQKQAYLFRSDVTNFDEASNNSTRYSTGYIENIYDYNNDDRGEHFTLDSWHAYATTLGRTVTTDDYLPTGTGSSRYGGYNIDTAPEDDIKGDYERHYSSGTVLTAGFEWHATADDQRSVFFDDGAIPGPYINGQVRTFVGKQAVSSAYLTYQTLPALGWTFLPGLRVEHVSRKIQGGRDYTENRLFPSLHLSHALGKGKMKLSYSRRIDRPQLNQYDPQLVYWSSHSASQGNPNLKSPQTDSYEVGYDYTKSSISYAATLYYRDLHDALSYVSTYAGNDVIISHFINSGQSRSGGVELTLKAPLLPKLKYSLNANLCYNELESGPYSPTGSRGAFTYSGNGMLEYDATGGDQWQVNMALTGETLTVQGYTSGNSHIDATWRHPLNKKVSLVVAATDIFNGMTTTTVTNSPDLKSRSFRPATNRSLRVSLSYIFGNGKK